MNITNATLYLENSGLAYKNVFLSELTYVVFPIVTAYVLPKLANYLCTPTNGTSSMDQLRNRLTEVRKTIKEILGEKGWFVATEVVTDNAWVSLLIIRCLLMGNEKALNEEQKMAVGLGIFAFSSFSWLVRYGLTINCPWLKKYIAPRSLS